MKEFLIRLCIPASFILLLGFVNSSSPKTKHLPLLRLVKNDSLKLITKSLGGHQGECISIQINNSISDSLYVKLEPGTRFIANDTSYQDILIVKEQLVCLNTKEQKVIIGNGYCCEATNHSPSANMGFDRVEKATKKLVDLSYFLNKYPLPDQTIQACVWAVSNNNPIANIIHPDADTLRMVRKFVSKLLGKEIPFYNVTYIQDSTVFSGKPERIFGEFEYQIYNLSMVDIILFDSKGNVVKTYHKGTPHQPKIYTFSLDEDITTWKRGRYVLKIYFDHALRYEKNIEI